MSIRGKIMYLLAIFLSISAILRCCFANSPNQPSEQIGASDSHSSGVKATIPLTPLPQADTRQYYDTYTFPFGTGHRPSENKRCPLCDSSVYPYCGERLLHDACCCTDPYIHDLPYQCKLADCRFLHANSCREHRLIANCCCSDDYRSLLKSFLKL